MSVFSMAASNPAAPTYPLQRSVRLRASASAFFNRTFGTPTSQNVWTYSTWMKISSTGTYTVLVAGASNYEHCYFSGGQIYYIAASTGGTNNLTKISTAVFRDPSAWYHVVVQKNASANSGVGCIRIWINNQEITTWSTNGYTGTQASVPNSLNVASTVTYISSSSNPFDGYLTETNFVDGQALTPSSFGAYNNYGVWSPAKYTGTYGTNGFYLNFQDNSSVTTTANVGIGKDSSGNGNYWTSNGINVTAYSGTPPNNTSYDSMLDVPTLTSNTNANFAVLNPVAGAASGSSYTITQANLYAVLVSGASTIEVPATMELPTTGQWYWEVTVVSVNTTYSYPLAIGISNQGGIGTAATFTNNYYYYISKSGNKFSNGTLTAYGATFTANDVIGVAFDASAGTLTFYKNNTSQGTAYTSLSGTFYPKFSSNDGCTIAVNFGQRPFSYTPPTGFKSLNTFNLPDSVAPVGAQYFMSTTYTGTGSALSITNTANTPSVSPYSNNPTAIPMQPDFVWIKGRATAYNHALFDSVRGARAVLISNNTNNEVVETAGTSMTAFNSNGFSLGTNGAQASTNVSTQTFVSWQWRASNASAVANTDGNITTQVSVNKTAGFSIVTYTGNGLSTATIGHGLGVIPAMVILKARSIGSNWWVNHKGAPNAYLQLDTTGQGLTGGGTNGALNYQSTNTATTFNFLAGSSTVNNVNQSAATYVAYCWSEIPGYSKFGSYTGNGASNGPFVYTGFRPRFVMIKCSSSGGSYWIMIDTTRDTYNLSIYKLGANVPSVENNTADLGSATQNTVDILSNGFKLRDTNLNTNSSQTYIYAAFAENPFKNALAR